VPSPTLPPATTTNAWLLNGHTIVDPAASTKKNKQALYKILEEKPPQQIFLTHHHNDHIGSASFLRKMFEIPIVCSAQTAKQLSFSIDRTLQEGDTLSFERETWHVYETPGHAQGHLCLHSPIHGDIVAGDMVAGEGTILLVPGDGDFGDYITQLQRLKDLSPLRLLPAHGPAITNAQDYLQQYIDHRKKRLQQILESLTPSPQTELELAQRIYTDIPKFMHPIAAKQIECHLYHLEEIQKAKHLETGWCIKVSE
jgi:glyoxylase-like metal-dependent hydrolase (beta-lactamase superfamily II)